MTQPPAVSPRPRRTYFEAPIMDERKWQKVPSIPADVFFVDMEDSVPPAAKEAAREKVVEIVGSPDFFAGREFVCRPNNLRTEWGADDLAALVEAGAPYIIYPKVRDLEELREVEAILARGDATPDVMLIVETPQAVLALEQLAACDCVTGFMFGPGDLAVETGIGLLDGADPFAAGMAYARGRTLMVARAHGLEAVDGAVFLADHKDMARLRRGAEISRLMGFTGMGCFYPPQVPIINEVMTPTAAEAAQAREVVEAYDAARAEGRAAVAVGRRAITFHEYRMAQQILSRVEAAR